MTQMVEFDADFYIQTNVPTCVPAGYIINSCSYSEKYECWVVSIHCSYDYEPFMDTKAPEFEFEADEITVDSAGEVAIERSVVYVSSPDKYGSRVTTRKES